MKKIILLFLFLFLSGCTAQYDLVYENENFSEKFSFLTDIKYQDSVDYYRTSNILTRYDVDLGDIPNEEFPKYYDCYENKYLNQDGKIGLEFFYNLKNKKILSSSTIATSLFKNIYVSDNLIRADDVNNVFQDYEDLDNLIITFKSDKNIYSSNADKIDNDIYYWYLNKDNYANKSIKIVFDNDSKMVKKYKDSVNKFLDYFVYIFLIFVLLFILFIYNKVKKSNK